MKAHLYHIETISNLHVGSGEANEGVIDNLIQRDAITDLPVIHSSSLKGALREHFKTSKVVKYIFGSEANDTSCREAGAFRFLTHVYWPFLCVVIRCLICWPLVRLC